MELDVVLGLERWSVEVVEIHDAGVATALARCTGLT
jgi:hypothetical protein